MKHFKLFSTVFFTVSLILSGCKDDDTVNEQPAPSLPPSSSFIMDFSSFPNQSSNNGRIQVGEYENWGYAILNVAAWQSALLHLAIPVAAFGESFNHDPVFIAEQQKWNWSYDVVHHGQTYQANLYAKLSASDVKWEMYVTKNGVYENFLWFEGTSKFDKTSGNWSVYTEPEGESRKYLTIEWINDGDDKEIKYISVDELHELNGSYIHYGTSSSDGFDSFYNIYSKKDNNLLEIDYHTENKSGRVKSEKYFGSENWYCWNSSLLNSECL